MKIFLLSSGQVWQHHNILLIFLQILNVITKFLLDKCSCRRLSLKNSWQIHSGHRKVNKTRKCVGVNCDCSHTHTRTHTHTKRVNLKFYELESLSFRFLPLNGHLNTKFPRTTEQEWHQNKDLPPKVVQLSHDISSSRKK